MQTQTSWQMANLVFFREILLPKSHLCVCLHVVYVPVFSIAAVLFNVFFGVVV